MALPHVGMDTLKRTPIWDMGGVSRIPTERSMPVDVGFYVHICLELSSSHTMRIGLEPCPAKKGIERKSHRIKVSISIDESISLCMTCNDLQVHRNILTIRL